MHAIQSAAFILHQMWWAHPTVMIDVGIHFGHPQFAGAGFLARIVVMFEPAEGLCALVGMDVGQIAHDADLPRVPAMPALIVLVVSPEVFVAKEQPFHFGIRE